MFARLIVPAVAAALVIATSAFAAGTSTKTESMMPKTQVAKVTPAQRCTELQHQFDSAIQSHRSAAMAPEAKMMRNDGGKLCAQGQHAAGAAKIEEALKDLGVKPKM